MLTGLLVFFIACVCAVVMLLASQSGWLSSITLCLMLGFTFAYLLAFAINPPTPLIIMSAALFSALLIWLGQKENINV